MKILKSHGVKMTKQARLRCFIAMAFGHDDTDRVYDRLIAPALRKNGVKPIRVDRIEHNDDIDDRIISEIESCDFALADLTYARPSVYFEAGYAQRVVPVIYTCRADHLSPRVDDQFGNFRIHFDLQMKNIIKWSDSRDAQFKEKLGKRITRVIAPILLNKAKRLRENEETAEFGSLPLQERLNTIFQASIACLYRIGFRGKPVDDSRFYSQFLFSPVQDRKYLSGFYYERNENIRQRVLVSRALGQSWIGRKSVKDAIHAAYVYVAPTLTQGALANLDRLLFLKPVYDLMPTSPNISVRLVEHLFVCSFAKVPESRVMSSLPRFKRDRESGEFVWSTEQIIPKRKIARCDTIYSRNRTFFVTGTPMLSGNFGFEKPDCTVKGQKFDFGRKRVGIASPTPRHVHIHIIDSIKSEKDFAREFADTLEQVERE